MTENIRLSSGIRIAGKIGTLFPRPDPFSLRQK
nr:MAG TPA: hypothetical protein [Caudoviricetes sp.]